MKTRLTFFNIGTKVMSYTYQPDNIKNKKNVDMMLVSEIINQNVYRFAPEMSGVIVDLGADIGVFSMLASQHEATRIIAVEPNDDNAHILSENIYNNNLERITTIVEKAVTNRNGVVPFTRNSADSKVGGEDEVQSVTLTALFTENKIDKVDFLKCDIEGSEYSIFNNLSIEMLNKIKYIAIEFHSTDKKTFGELICNLSQTHSMETLGSYKDNGYLYAKRY